MEEREIKEAAGEEADQATTAVETNQATIVEAGAEAAAKEAAVLVDSLGAAVARNREAASED